MEPAVIAALVMASASIVGSGLVYLSASKLRREAREEKRQAAEAKAKEKSDEDTTTIRVKKLESADEFREELIRLWKESRDGWAKCERDRVSDMAKSEADVLKLRREHEAQIGKLRREVKSLRDGLSGVGKGSYPPPEDVID